MPATPSDSAVVPELTASLSANLTLPTPIVAAAGTFGYGTEIADMADCRALGALITPTLTLNARLGNPPLRTAEASAGLIHAIGLPNPGLKVFLKDYLPGLSALPCPVIVSILGQTPAEWTQLASGLSAAGGLAALELNLTPLPLQSADHVSQPLPSEAALRRSLSKAIGAVRAATSLPLIAKLPSIGIEIGTAARAAAESGADVIAVSQAFPAIAVRLSSSQFRFPGVIGGLSGPCIKPLALYQVWRAAQAVSLPVLGVGGIMTLEDMLEFFFTGASAVAVGVANTIHPTAIAQLTEELTAYLKQQRLSGIHEIAGAALRATPNA
jgi:dihydroorotate dehydrogenase (NAD+) catalytic subunit